MAPAPPAPAARRCAARGRRRAAQRRRPATVARRAVRAGEHVQPGQQRPGVAHVAPNRRVGPLARAVPVEPQVQLDEPRRRRRCRCCTAAPACRLRAIRAPTTSWWWKVTPPPGSNRRVRGLPMSCSRAARRSTGSVRSPARACSRSMACSSTTSECSYTSLCRWCSSISNCSAGAPGGRNRRARSRRAARGPRADGARSNLVSSTRGPARPRRSRSARPSPSIAVATGSATVKPSWDTNRAARIIRSGSSANDSCGRRRGAQHAPHAGRPARRARRRGRRTAGSGPSR